MEPRGSPIGLLVTPARLRIYRDRYVTPSEKSIELIGEFDVRRLFGSHLEQAGRNAAFRFENDVQDWLESLASKPPGDELSPELRHAAEWNIRPAISQGIIRADIPDRHSWPDSGCGSSLSRRIGSSRLPRRCTYDYVTPLNLWKWRDAGKFDFISIKFTKAKFDFTGSAKLVRTNDKGSQDGLVIRLQSCYSRRKTFAESGPRGPATCRRSRFPGVDARPRLAAALAPSREALGAAIQLARSAYLIWNVKATSRFSSRGLHYWHARAVTMSRYDILGCNSTSEARSVAGGVW